jgi:Methyltransferase domain
LNFFLTDPLFGSQLAQIEKKFGTLNESQRQSAFDRVPLDVFMMLCIERPSQFPNIVRWLPLMPIEEIQIQYTGAAGVTVVSQGANFIRLAIAAYEKVSVKPINQAKILDYGVGWGRLMRLMYKYVPTSQLYGVDAWSISIDLAKSLDFRCDLSLIDQYPETLPFKGKKFDLIYAFSVFTHLSPKAAHTAIRAIRPRIADDGLLVITIRPRSYWEYHPGDNTDAMLQHDRVGFGYKPHNRGEVDGDTPYGDSSISLDYIAQNWTEFKIYNIEVSIADSYQIIVYLQPIK